jgi:hypothetical protein
MHKSTRAAVFVLVCLLITLVAGLVLYLRYAGLEESAVALLAGCALVAFVFAVLAIRITLTYRRSRRLELRHGVPPNRVLRALELRQWLILTVGISFIAVATGAGTALGVVGDDSPAVLPAAPATVPVTTEPTTTPPTEQEPTPSETTDPPAETTTEPGPVDSPDDAPATKYLDSEDPLAGGFNAEAVNFAAQRYPRGIQFWCTSVTSSRLQWNVAGYRNFTAVAGIDDRTADTFGAIVEFIFYDQDGRQLVPKPVEVSVGRARKVSIDLSGVVSLRMTCASRDTKTGDQRSTRSALGDPIIVQ